MYDIINVTPGEDVNIPITVPTMTEGTTAASASLVFKDREGAVTPILTVNITTVAGAGGVITDPTPGGSALLTFYLTDTQTQTLANARLDNQPYLVYSVQVVNNAGDILYTVPLGRMIFTLKA